MEVYKVPEELAERVAKAKQTRQELDEARKEVITELTGLRVAGLGRVVHFLQFTPEEIPKEIPEGLISGRNGMLKADITTEAGKRLNQSYKKKLRRYPRPERLTQIFREGIPEDTPDFRVKLTLDKIDDTLVITDHQNVDLEKCGCEKVGVGIKG